MIYERETVYQTPSIKGEQWVGSLMPTPHAKAEGLATSGHSALGVFSGEAPALARCLAHSRALARLLNQNPPTTALLLALTKPTSERWLVAQYGPGATSGPRCEEQPPNAGVS